MVPLVLESLLRLLLKETTPAKLLRRRGMPLNDGVGKFHPITLAHNVRARSLRCCTLRASSTVLWCQSVEVVQGEADKVHAPHDRADSLRQSRC